MVMIQCKQSLFAVKNKEAIVFIARIYFYLLFVVLLSVLPAFADTVVEYNYNLDTVGSTTVTDTSGNGYDGTASNGATVIANGKSSHGLSLPSSSSTPRPTVIIDDNSELRITGDLTLSAWIYRERDDGDTSVIFTKTYTSDGSGDHNSEFWFGIEHNKLHYDHYSSAGGQEALNGATEIPFEEWVYVALVRDSTNKTIKIYINGALDASGTYNHDPDSTTKDVTIGWCQPCEAFGDYFFVGKMDCNKIYNNALSSNDITIDMNACNNCPYANDDTNSTNEDTTLTVDTANGVLSNDTDADGDSLSVASATIDTDGDGNQENLSIGTATAIRDSGGNDIGTVTLNSDGSYTFAPAANWNGSVPEITYIVTDGICPDAATLNITVNSVNDAPVASNDTATTDEDTVLNGDVSGNDVPSGDGGNVWAKQTDPLHGTVTMNNDGTYTYTPNANYNGNDSFDYTITDADGDNSTATVTITINSVNDVPVAQDDSDSTDYQTPVTINVLDNDSDPDGDSLSVTSASDPAHGSVTINSDGTITYTPDNGFSGTDTFTYEISDGHGGTDTATVTVNVGTGTAHVFDPPSATKVANAGGWPEIEWKMVWINDGNATAQRVLVEDPIDANVTYINGSLSCTAQGSSTTIRCEYDSVRNMVVWEGDIAPDPGATDEASAANEVVIVFRTTVHDGVTGVENQATGYWDRDGDGDIDSNDRTESVVTDDPATGSVRDSTKVNHVTTVPTLSEWGIIILSILLSIISVLYIRRQKSDY
jgi:VCBS repeat-containing protein